MRAKVLQIIWHDKDPVYSLDFHPSGLLATAGGDKEIKLWRVGQEKDGSPTVEHCTNLTGGHTRTVNCVRFSPTGEHLASGGDGGELFLWKANMELLKEDETHWGRCILRSHTDDVQDLEWAPDGSGLASGSIDNSVVLWDVATGRGALRLEGHKHFVQGCAWDPAGRYVATQSADRTVRIYGVKPPVAGKKGRASHAAASCMGAAKDLVCQHVLAKGPPIAQPVEAGGVPGKVQRPALFADEHVLTFFRRLAWSPDGSFLAVPTGLYRRGNAGSPGHTTHIYARGHWDAPVAHLPVLASPVVAVAFCPQLFALRPPVPGDAVRGAAAGSDAAAAAASAAAAAPAASPAAAAGVVSDENALVQLPYRMVFVVATTDSVFLYDTQGMRPLAVLGALHMDCITDVAWACDAATLAVSSRDGYCSLTSFAPGELGLPAPQSVVPPHIARRMAAAAKALPPRPPPQAPKAQPAAPSSAAASSQQQASSSAGGQVQAPARQQVQPPPCQAAGRRILPQAMPAGTSSAQPFGSAAPQQQRPLTPQAVPPPASQPGGAESQQRRIAPQPVTPSAAAPAAAAPAVAPTADGSSSAGGKAAVAAAAEPAQGTAAQEGGAVGGDAPGGLKREGSAVVVGGDEQAAKKQRRLTPVSVSHAGAIADTFASVQPANSDASQLASPENSRGAPPMPKHAPSRRITPMALVRPQQQGAAEPAAQEWKQE